MKNQMNLNGKTVLISRTDSIGDVVLTLPMAIWIKKNFPQSKVIFLGNTYTAPIIECVNDIDKVICWADWQDLPIEKQREKLIQENVDVFIHALPRKKIAQLAKKANIPYRVGTFNRLFHFFTCNIKPHFSRKNSDFNEAQLNFELLRFTGLNALPTYEELSHLMLNSFQAPTLDDEVYHRLGINRNTPYVILHPKSQGNGIEWPIMHYIKLAQHLLNNGYFVIFTGTEKEGIQFRHLLPQHPNCIDSTHKLTLKELIGLIKTAQALVASGTGPLHISGVCGTLTIGLFPPRRPIHPGRWQPLGSRVHALVHDDNCPTCQEAKHPCNCIELITPERVLSLIQQEAPLQKPL